MALPPIKMLDLAAIDQAALQNASAYNQLKFSSNKMARDRQLQEIGSSSGDPEEVIENLRKNGFHDEAMKMSSALSREKFEQTQAELNMMKALRQRAELVTDQSSYDAFLNDATQGGTIPNNILPPDYEKGKEQLNKFILGSKTFEDSRQKDLDRAAGITRSVVAAEATKYAADQRAATTSSKLKKRYVGTGGQTYSPNEILSMYKTDQDIEDDFAKDLMKALNPEAYQRMYAAEHDKIPLDKWALENLGVTMFPAKAAAAAGGSIKLPGQMSDDEHAAHLKSIGAIK